MCSEDVATQDQPQPTTAAHADSMGDTQQFTKYLQTLLPSDKIEEDWSSQRSQKMLTRGNKEEQVRAMETIPSEEDTTESFEKDERPPSQPQEDQQPEDQPEDAKEETSTEDKEHEGEGENKEEVESLADSLAQQRFDLDADNAAQSCPSLLGDCQSMLLSPESAGSLTSKDIMAALSTKAVSKR